LPSEPLRNCPSQQTHVSIFCEFVVHSFSVFFKYNQLTTSFSSFTFSLAGVAAPGILLTLGFGIPGVGSLLIDGFWEGEALTSVRTVSCDCRTNIPWFSGHVKYCFPWTKIYYNWWNVQIYCWLILLCKYATT
jgi:hypothetical protein